MFRRDPIFFHRASILNATDLNSILTSAAVLASDFQFPSDYAEFDIFLSYRNADIELALGVHTDLIRRAFGLGFAIVLVVAAPPDAGLVASFGRAIEPLVHAPEAVQSARGSDDLPGQFV